MADASRPALDTSPSRDSPVRHTMRTVGLVLGLLALLLVVAAGAYRAWRMPGGVAGEGYAAEECRAAYARARSSADTAAVDARQPVVSREQATAARTCRELRLGWALR